MVRIVPTVSLTLCLALLTKSTSSSFHRLLLGSSRDLSLWVEGVTAGCDRFSILILLDVVDLDVIETIVEITNVQG